MKLWKHRRREACTQESIRTSQSLLEPSPKERTTRITIKNNTKHNKKLFPVFIQSSLLRNNSQLFTIPFDSPTKTPRRERRLRGGNRGVVMTRRVARAWKGAIRSDLGYRGNPLI